ncbi:unnamed protein product [Camellia sinensis]
MHTTELCIAGLSLVKGPKGDTHGRVDIDRFIRLTGCEVCRPPPVLPLFSVTRSPLISAGRSEACRP